MSRPTDLPNGIATDTRLHEKIYTNGYVRGYEDRRKEEPRFTQDDAIALLQDSGWLNEFEQECYQKGVKDTEAELLNTTDFSQGEIVKEVEEAYKAGAEEAWRCAQRISMMHLKDIEDAGLVSWIEYVDPWKASCILISMITADEAISKIQNWEKKLQKAKEIRVGKRSNTCS